jgi:hypothetical protein
MSGRFVIVGPRHAPERLGAIPAGWKWEPDAAVAKPLMVPATLVRQVAMGNALIQARQQCPNEYAIMLARVLMGYVVSLRLALPQLRRLAEGGTP